MKRPLIILSFIFTALMLSTVHVPFVQAAPPGSGSIGSACTDTVECVSGLICDNEPGQPNNLTCQNLTVSIVSAATTATQITSTLKHNSPLPPNIYSCIGTTCNAQPVTDTNFWTPSSTYSGLRPSRTYQYNISATTHGSTATASRNGLVTWPGYGFTPTESNAGCPGGLCQRDISWTTPFAGDSKVYYSLDAPNWMEDFTVSPSPSTFSYVTSLSSGRIWAATYQGEIYQRSSVGVWSKNSFPFPAALGGVDFIDAGEGWVVGDNGITARTTDGGNSWQTVPLPGSAATNLYSVSISQLGGAWSTGDAQKIYHYSGSSWTQVYSDALPNRFFSVISLNNHEVFAAGTSGIVNKSTDGGLSWQTTTLPNAAGSAIYSLASVDGKTIWAGGSNGKLWRTTDSGQNWFSVTSGTNQQITKIVTASPKEVWFSSLGGVGHSTDADTITPSFTLDTVVLAILANVRSLTLTTNAEIVAAGNSSIVINSLCHPSNCSSSVYTPAITSNHTVVLSGLAQNTTYYYIAQSFDASIGAASFGGSFTTPILDTIKPTVTINAIAPAINTCTGSLTVTGTAADTSPGSVQSVKVTLDSNPPLTATGTTSWSIPLPCAQVTPGSHTVTAISNDGTNDSLPATATIIFDTTNPTVTISAPSPVTTSTVNVTGTAGDNDQVAKVEIQVNGSGGRTNVPITAGASISWNMNNVSLVPGVNTIVAYATDRAGNEISAAKNVTYNVPTFSLTATPPTSQTVAAGTTATFGLSVAAVDGFTGTITFSASASPNTITPAFSASTVTLTSTTTSATTNLLVPSTRGAGSGPYTVTVTGTSGSLTKSVQVTLTLTDTPDFTLSVNPASRPVVAGNSGIYVLTVSGTSTYTLPSGGISWTTSALYSGMTATFAPMAGNPRAPETGTVQLTLTTTTAVANGTYSIILTATDGTITHPITIDLTVTPPPDFTLTIAPASAATVAGSGNSGAYNLTVKSVNGYTGLVHLSLASTPVDPAVHVLFSQNDFTPTAVGDMVTLNVTADNTVLCAPVPPPPSFPSPCNYDLTITGAPSQLTVTTKTVSATLAITPDTTPPTISGIAAIPSDHDVTISWTTNEPANSRFDLYADAERTRFIGFKDDTSNTYCLITCHTQTYSTILPSLTTFYYTVTSVDQAYPNGNAATVSSDTNGPLKFTTSAAPDNTFPTLTINSPAGGTGVSGLVAISGSAAEDNNPRSQVVISFTGPAGST